MASGASDPGVLAQRAEAALAEGRVSEAARCARLGAAAAAHLPHRRCVRLPGAGRAHLRRKCVHAANTAAHRASLAA